MDWRKAKLDYIMNPDETYRTIAERYGVSHAHVGVVAKREGWVDLRRQKQEAIYKKTEEKEIDSRAERAMQVQSVADKLLAKISQAIELVTAENLLVNTKSIRALSGALMDIRSIFDLRSKEDLAEQAARIDKLRREAEKDTKTAEAIEVVIKDGLEDYTG